VHFGRIATMIFVALDRPGEPPALVAARRQQRLSKRGLGRAKRDQLE